MPLCAECRREVDAVELSRFAASPRCRACQQTKRGDRHALLQVRLTVEERAALARVVARRKVRLSPFVRQILRAVVAKCEARES